MPEVSIYPCDIFGDWKGQLKSAQCSYFEDAMFPDIGQAEITYDPLDAAASEFRLLENQVQIWLDGDLKWWGNPRERKGLLPGRLTAVCNFIAEDFKDRIVDDASLLYTAIDQVTIWRDLILFAQSEATQAHRNLNITFPAYALTGHLRSRNYLREQHQQVWDLLMEWATLDDGFEWYIEIFGDGRREATPYYPRKGTLKNEHHLFFEVGSRRRNITSLNFSESASQLGTHGYVTGGSSGDVKFEQNYEDVAASAKYKLRQFVVADGSQLDVGWLHDHAVREVNDRKQTVVLPTVKIPRFNRDGVDMMDNVEGIAIGDTIPIDVNYGDVQIHDTTVRVIKRRWNADDTIDITIAGE